MTDIRKCAHRPTKTLLEMKFLGLLIAKNINIANISLQKGSSANYAGDGPSRKYGCLNLNGIYITKSLSKILY